MKQIIFAILILSFTVSFGQIRWQQKVDYKMEIDMDVKKDQYTGKMAVTYFNHSPDELKEIYFHLYFNAFQPGSVMDQRLTTVPDPDGRMVNNTGTKQQPKYESRIANLKPNEIGFQDIKSIKQNDKTLKYSVSGTVMKVELAESLKPNENTTLHLDWLAQVPLQIRRSGRDNFEGIEYSMTQWYPKIAAYDNAGWHLDEYVGREFYAPFGNFDVKIELPHNYIVGSSGELKNSNQMPGYSKNGKKSGTNEWHFTVENIHDFAWAADPDFIVETQQVVNGPMLYFVYDKNINTKDNWVKSKEYTAQFFSYMDKNFGKYPWPTYTVVQGGDGGMEYGTVTLVTGGRNFESLIGVIMHEAAHSWFQHLFGFDETQDEWMDEGFTSYAEAAAMADIFGTENPENPFLSAYSGYYNLVKSGAEEPMTTLADYYNLNYAYSIAAYYKGQVFLSQLGYIIGEENLKKTMLQFYEDWKFNHPQAHDLQKIAQEVSGINLKWYFNLFVKSTRFIDYGVANVIGNQITLENYSNLPMPIDVLVTYEDNTQELFTIPLMAMRNAKPAEKAMYPTAAFSTLSSWAWPSKLYTFEVKNPVKSVEIDPTKRLADVNQENNIFPYKPE